MLQIRSLTVQLPATSAVAGNAGASDERVSILRGIDLQLDAGKTLGIIGESGCGKSMTALAIMGLLPESAVVQGSIEFGGQELVGLPDKSMCQLRGASMAMIFQEPMTALNPLHTIGRQIAEPLRLHQHLSSAAARKRAIELLGRVQIPNAAQRIDSYPHQLSGGQRQRVMIAIALACKPKLLIADEPTTALDVTVQKQILGLISKLVREDGMSLLLISHDLSLMHDHVEDVMVMYAGSVIESASTRELFKERLHPYTQGLFAARPRMGLPRGTRLKTIPGTVPDMASIGLGCAFAPRCEKAVSDCNNQLPALLGVPNSLVSQPQRTVRCPRWQFGARTS